MSCEVFVLVKYYRKDTIRKAFVRQSIPSRNWVNSAGDIYYIETTLEKPMFSRVLVCLSLSQGAQKGQIK